MEIFGTLFLTRRLLNMLVTGFASLTIKDQEKIQIKKNNKSYFFRLELLDLLSTKEKTLFERMIIFVNSSILTKVQKNMLNP
jgi:hypothetical protein